MSDRVLVTFKMNAVQQNVQPVPVAAFNYPKFCLSRWRNGSVEMTPAALPQQCVPGNPVQIPVQPPRLCAFSVCVCVNVRVCESAAVRKRVNPHNNCCGWAINNCNWAWHELCALD